MTAYLSETNAHRFAVLDAAGHAVIATDTTGAIGYWNGAAERLYGWRREEVIGKNIVDVTPSDQSRDESMSIMRLLAAGELWSGIFGVRHRDGHRFEAAVTDIPIRQRATTVGIVGVSAENTGPADVRSTLDRFATRQSVRVRTEGDIGAMTAHVSEPHLIQLFTILLLKIGEAASPARVWIAVQRSTPALRMDFGIASEHDWLFMRFSPEPQLGQAAAIHEALRNVEASPYAASLVALAGGRLFASTVPGSGAAFHLFLPVN